MKIVADDRIPFLKGVFEPYAQVVYLPGKQIYKDDLLNADALITRSVTKCNAELLDGTNVKLIATATIGDDHIDRAFCRENGIEIATAPGCNASAVEQYICSALLTLAEKKHFTLKGMNLGIVGVGNVGSRVMRIAEILGMKVFLNDPPRAEKEADSVYVDLDTLLANSDIITLHVPLNYDGDYSTYHLADDAFFAKIVKPVVFLNSSRGKVVDTIALKNAIANGKLKSTVLDVWENEPDIDTGLLKTVNIATPHIAGYSLEGKARATRMTVESVSKFFGFGIENVPFLPDEDKEVLKIDCKGKDEQYVLYKAVSGSYNIQKDDTMLRKEPVSFEELRRNYSFRREFGQYHVRTTNCNEDIKHKLEKLGFYIN